MFENLEHGNIWRRPNEDSSFGLDADDKETAKRLPRLGQPSVNNLAESRPGQRHRPGREEERRLILAAQAGNKHAMRRLVDYHVAWIRWRARLRWYRTIGLDDAERAVTLDDFVSVGLAEFAQQIKTWKPPYRLNTHCRKAVDGALADFSYQYRNKPALGGVESDIQRFLRTHPGIDAAGVQAKFSDFTKSEIEHEIQAYINLGIRPSGKARFAGFGDRYSETGCGDDDGDHDADGNFKSGGETNVDHLYPDQDSAVSQWSLQARQHSKTDRYFADGWWSVWNPPPLVKGPCPRCRYERRKVRAGKLETNHYCVWHPQVGWEREQEEDRLAPLLKVAEREPPSPDKWRPQSGYVDENDYRGLGEGLSSLRSCAVRPPPPMPTGQADSHSSYWNACGVSRLNRSINLIPTLTDPPPSFEDDISSISATEITKHSIDIQKAA
jgi:hypothetical protein